MFFVYILKDSSNKIYIGQTQNLDERFRIHSTKHKDSSKFVKANGEFQLVYSESYQTRIEAMRREKQLKGWTRAKKEALITNDLQLLKKL